MDTEYKTFMALKRCSYDKLNEYIELWINDNRDNRELSLILSENGWTEEEYDNYDRRRQH